MILTAVIVTFNRLKDLKTTIEKSLEFGFDNIVIINNASTDGTTEYLKSLSHSSLKITHCDKNLGGAAGFKKGLEEALKIVQSGWICLYDDDAYPLSERAVVEKELAKYDSKTGIVAGAVYLPDGAISEMNRVAKNPFKSPKLFLAAVLEGRSGFHIKDEDYRGDHDLQIDTASFVGSLVNVEALIKSRVTPNEKFFIYADDVLFSYELTEKGYKNYFSPKISFIHNCQAFDSKMVYQPLWKIYYLTRNVLTVYAKISKFLFPLIFIKFSIQWYLRGKNYNQQKQLYLKLLKLGLRDFISQNYSRPHSDIVAISKGEMK